MTFWMLALGALLGVPTVIIFSIIYRCVDGMRTDGPEAEIRTVTLIEAPEPADVLRLAGTERP